MICVQTRLCALASSSCFSRSETRFSSNSIYYLRVSVMPSDWLSSTSRSLVSSKGDSIADIISLLTRTIFSKLSTLFLKSSFSFAKNQIWRFFCNSMWPCLAVISVDSVSKRRSLQNQGRAVRDLYVSIVPTLIFSGTFLFTLFGSSYLSA